MTWMSTDRWTGREGVVHVSNGIHSTMKTMKESHLQQHCHCCSVAQLYLTLCDPMDCSTPGLPVLHPSRSLPKLMFIELVTPSNHLILCRPLLLLPSIFPSISIFPNESALCIRWPKCWSLSFSIGPSNEYSGLMNLKIIIQSEVNQKETNTIWHLWRVCVLTCVWLFATPWTVAFQAPLYRIQARILE